MDTDRAAVDLADAGEGFLASAAALGDREAFEIVVHRYGPMLFRYARRMLANHLAAEHPDWDQDRIEQETSRRISHGAI